MYISQRKENDLKEICTPMFITAPLTIRGEAASVSVDGSIDKENRVHVFSGMLFSLTEEGNLIICWYMDELENIMLHEISQALKNNECMVLLM